ncbi:hypothetical protein ILP92_05205 [Maribius pontilimi]|uniref:MHYT domain-containing protein n=1 Tax=Palleronia pontilimi TaxID=1964209 RepID=A0A934MBW7_9RHOB|nr:MHYT domain-containing protein [Palleronia pontilimi]MBJ3762138.1 hypothetical protein [Palleronia pontilimi]
MSFFDSIQTCLTEQHDPLSLVASVFICGLGSFSGYALLTETDRASGKRRRRLFVLCVATLASTVWVTHFGALLGYSDGIELQISVGWTLLSLGLAALLYAAAAFQLLHAHASPLRAALAAVTLTGAVGLMHFAGIQAYRTSATILWQTGFVALAVALCLGLSLVACLLYACFDGLIRTLGSPIVFALSIAALHFTAMSGMTLVPFGTTAPEITGSAWLRPLVEVGIVVIICGGSFAVAIWDRRRIRLRHV